jgi:hypothetical protein
MRRLSGHNRKHACAKMIYKRSRQILRGGHFARSVACVLTVDWTEVLCWLCRWTIQRVAVEQIAHRRRITLLSVTLSRPQHQPRVDSAESANSKAKYRGCRAKVWVDMGATRVRVEVLHNRPISQACRLRRHHKRFSYPGSTSICLLLATVS